MKKWILASCLLLTSVVSFANDTELIATQHIERCYSGAFYAGEYKAALDHIEALLTIQPDNVDYLREKAKMLIVLKQLPAAVSLIIRIEQIGGEPANKAIWEVYNWQPIQEDRKTLKSLLSDNSHIMTIWSIEPYTRKGELYSVVGGYEASVLAKYGQTSFAEATTMRTQNVVEKHASAKSLFAIPSVTVSAPMDSATRIKRLTEAYNAAFSADNYEQALLVVEQLLLEQPNNVEYLREKVKMLAGVGNGGQSLEALKLFPSDEAGKLAMAEACNWDKMPNNLRQGIQEVLQKKAIISINARQPVQTAVVPENDGDDFWGNLSKEWKKRDHQYTYEERQRETRYVYDDKQREIQTQIEDTKRKQEAATRQANLDNQFFKINKDYDSAVAKINKDFKQTFKRIDEKVQSSEENVETYFYNGRDRKVFTGPRGGKYIHNGNKKVYLSSLG